MLFAAFVFNQLSELTMKSAKSWTDLCLPAACVTAAAPVDKWLYNTGIWGTWFAAVYCPLGQYIVGFNTRTEGRQGSGDDTALNS